MWSIKYYEKFTKWEDHSASNTNVAVKSIGRVVESIPSSPLTLCLNMVNVIIWYLSFTIFDYWIMWDKGTEGTKQYVREANGSVREVT